MQQESGSCLQARDCLESAAFALAVLDLKTMLLLSPWASVTTEIVIKKKYPHVSNLSLWNRLQAKNYNLLKERGKKCFLLNFPKENEEIVPFGEKKSSEPPVNSSDVIGHM